MGNGRAIAVAAGAGVAAWALDRRASGAAGDAYTKAPPPPKPDDQHAARAAAAALASLSPPCGAPRKRYSDLPVNQEGHAQSFAIEWGIEVRSLRERFGEVMWLKMPTGRPAITAECALAWLDDWLDAWWLAHSQQPIRYTVGVGNLELTDPRTLPAGSVVGNILGDGGISTLGQAWRRMVAARNVAQWTARDSRSADAKGATYAHVATVVDTIRDFAAALDGCTARDLSGTAGEEALELAKGVAKGAANGVAWVFEEVLGPVIGAAGAAAVGALVSAVGPVVLVGGVAYIVLKRAA